jgi:hypothetical protein
MKIPFYYCLDKKSAKIIREVRARAYLTRTNSWTNELHKCYEI